MVLQCFLSIWGIFYRVDLVSLHIAGYDAGPQKTSKEKANEREQGQEEFEKML